MLVIKNFIFKSNNLNDHKFYLLIRTSINDDIHIIRILVSGKITKISNIIK